MKKIYTFIAVFTVCFYLNGIAQTAYITNQTANSVSVINLVNNTVVATIPVSNNPLGVAVSRDGNKVYVTNSGSNSVSVINTTNNKFGLLSLLGIRPGASL